MNHEQGKPAGCQQQPAPDRTPAGPQPDHGSGMEPVALELVLPDDERLLLVGKVVASPEALISVEIEPSPVNPQAMLYGLSQLAAAQSVDPLAGPQRAHPKAHPVSGAGDTRELGQRATLPDGEDWRLASRDALEAHSEFLGYANTDQLSPSGQRRADSVAVIDPGPPVPGDVEAPQPQDSGAPHHVSPKNETPRRKRRASSPQRGGAAAKEPQLDASMARGPALPSGPPATSPSDRPEPSAENRRIRRQ